MMMLKISLGIFFARIVVKPWQMGLIYVNVGVNVFSSAATFFYCLFRCGPNIDDYVVQQLLDKCTPRTLDRFMAYQQAAITTLTDLVFVALPAFVLWNANMSRTSKISVGFILSLAATSVYSSNHLLKYTRLTVDSGVICSLLRFRYVDGLTDTQDFFWASVNISIWSTIECGASIIAGCLATLRPLIKRIISKTRVTTTLGSCVKQVSRSFRSNERSSSSTIPRFNSASTEAKSSDSRDKQSSTRPKEQSLLEFLARPGEEVIAMNDREEHGRESTDRILRQPSLSSVEFPWPVKMNERRQTIHASWTLRNGVASDGRTCERSLSQ
jgi:hypothetical protein